MPNTSPFMRAVAIPAAVAALAGGLAATPANAAPAPRDTTYDITVNAPADAPRALDGRQLTAYKLADYVDGTFVNVGNKDLDGVAVNTPDALRGPLDRVLAKTAGKPVANLPGWKAAGGDPVAWMGGFRQNAGADQAAGTFGFGWNDSGPQHKGNNSPTKAYTGTVREFADNIVKDTAALNAVKTQQHSDTVTCHTGASCTIPLTSSGLYLIIDTGAKTTSKWNDQVYNTGTTQPMIVPTKADRKDLATQKVNGKATTDGTRLGTVGPLGVITIKNVTDSEPLPPDRKPKRLDTSTAQGQDAADHASDVGDTIPYIVNYRVPDLSAYKAAYDNKDNWIYNYRIVDQTDPGLKITSVSGVTATIQGIDGKDTTIPLTVTKTLPGYAPTGTGTPDGQPGEQDAWVHLANDDTKDSSHLVVGLGRWLVKNYGDIRVNDKTKTLYGKTITVRYTATVTPKVLQNGNRTKNANHLEYSNQPDKVDNGEYGSTITSRIRQWTYDIDLHKRASTSNAGLAGAKFKVTVKDNANKADAKANGATMKWVLADGTAGNYRQAVAGDQNVTDTVTTGRDGLLRLRGLDLGVYTLTETAAPRNYQQLMHPEDVTIAATFMDDKTNWTTPDVQTSVSETITRNNSILALKKMFTFEAPAAQAPAGMVISDTQAIWGAPTDINGKVLAGTPSDVAKNLKNASGAYVADDKTSFAPAGLTLLDQPINVMLAQTGGVITFGVAGIMGIILVAAGVTVLIRRRTMVA